MIIEQYEDFLGSLGCEIGYNPYSNGFQKYNCSVNNLNVPVLVTSEKYKDLYGKVFPLRSLEGAKLKIEVSPNKLSTVYYYEVYPVDKFGNPIIFPIVDMTGRAISENLWIAYMAPDPRTNKTGFGIAQVNSINTKGELSVTLKMFDGSKKSPDEKTNFVVSNPKRTIIIPFESSDFVRLILTDFDRFDNDPA